jgi:hypothetical protein
VVTVLAGEVQELEGQIQQQVQALVPQLLQLLGSAQSSLACCWPK